jgi:type IV secretion system protein VirB10
MKIFSGTAPAEDPGRDAEGTPQAAPAEPAARPIAGDRGVPAINRIRSVQSRVSNVLAVGLLTALGLGLLTWYYAKALTRPARAQHEAQAASRNRAQGDTALPSIADPIAALVARAGGTQATAPADPTTDAEEPSAAEALLGSAPALEGTGAAAPTPVGMPASGASYEMAPQKSAAQLAFERRLAGPAFARSSQDPGVSSASAAATTPASWMGGGHTGGATEGAEKTAGPALDGLLRPTVTPAVAASVLPTRRFLLAKGAFIDCTLETAIDSTLPGMTTCITATDTFSADGTVVLLERGTKLVGETRGQVQQGTSRIFVLWNEARTPTGVVVPLSSPGTDELGRSGLPGEVNRHFWDRFGAAILLTMVSGAVQGAVNSQNSTGSVVVSPSTSTDVMTEVLKSTVNIPPTVTKAQGDRIQVFVARDVDFRSVYALRTASAAAAGTRP